MAKGRDTIQSCYRLVRLRPGLSLPLYRRTCRGRNAARLAGGSGCPPGACHCARRSEEHTSELQSLMSISYAVFFLKQKKNQTKSQKQHHYTSHTKRTKQ